MTARHRSTGWVAGCAVAILLSAGALQEASAQGLGSVARAEAERRKSAPAGKVYTNEHLPAVPPAPAAAAAGGSAQTTPGDAADGKPAADKGSDKAPDKKDEAYWRERLKSLREAKARAESFAEALQSRINGLSTDFVNRDDPAQRNLIAADRQKALDELTRVQKEVREATRALEELQTDARREGVPAGWVR